MPSSISSSKLLRMAAWALAIFAAYGLGIAWWLPPVDFGQNQWANNRIHLEHFLYGARPDAVIVGSSMAGTLQQAHLAGIGNLALAGGSALTGLAVLTRLPTPPAVVYVEVNVLDRPGDPALVDSLFHPLFMPLRAHIAALRVTYQPVNLLFWSLRRWHHGDGAGVEDHPPVAPEMRAMLLAGQRQSYEAGPAMPQLAANLEQLARDVAILEQRGSKVVFFEMPVDPSLLPLAGRVQSLKALQERFPDRMVCAVGSEQDGLETGDGIHLAPGAAQRVALGFRERIHHCLF